MSNLEQVSLNCYRLPTRKEMNAEALIFLKEELLDEFSEHEALHQLAQAATLPGVYQQVLGMPDIHSGFGLPIGGVMPMDAREGLVSAGAVGMDINCGVRLLRTNLPAETVKQSTLKSLLKSINKRVPSGVGKKSMHHQKVRQYFSRVITEGVPFLISQGLGRPEDLEAIEERGVLSGVSVNSLSKEALGRGDQLSTIGGGNHFIEIGYVDKIFDQQAAYYFGLEKGKLTIMIHTGSRGFGHQICTDYTGIMKRAAQKSQLPLPHAGLAAAPVLSKEGQDYLSAMSAAVNFAFCNRQWITHDIREAFTEALGGSDHNYDLGLVYDVAHNIAKFEEIEGKSLLIHRKGAVRALPAGHPLNPPLYQETGHPVIIPGSMGTPSYVVVGGPQASHTFYSANHGAGRVMSRRAAKKNIDVEDFKKQMGGVILWSKKTQAFLDEAPRAYKNIEPVVDTLAEIGVTNKVARLKPLAVIKGEGSEA